jgi:hypothetical protein
VLSLFCSTAGAKELYGPEAGVVPFGMGRAYSAIADDWLALHYNPAGLALVKKLDFQLLELRLGVNETVLQNYSNFKDLGGTSGGALANTLDDFTGKRLMAAGGNITQLTIPHMALAMIYDTQTNFNLENQAYPQTEMRYTKDLGFMLGGAVGMGKRKDLRVGLAVKYINRTGSSRSVPVSDLAGNRNSILDGFKSSGTGIGADFGLQYRLPTSGRTEITTSFVWHDIGHTRFGTSHQKSAPSAIEQNIVAGLGVRFPIGGRKNRRLERRYGPSRSTNHLSFAFDYSHLNYGWDKEHLPKHTHFGMNLDLPLLSLQLGLNQTSITYGTSFDIGVVRVSVASYAEELGNYGGQKTDRRYLVSIGSGFGFGGL